MYPFTNEIGSMKVSEALPMLGVISNDYKLELAVVSPNPQRIHQVVWRKNHMEVAKRIHKNSKRNN